MAQEEDQKVKVVYHNDPKRFRFVTKAGAAALSTKWVLADDQSGAPNPNGQKKVVAAPAESTIDKKIELREKYNELTGKEAEPAWNEARLFVEIVKVEKASTKEAPAEQPIQEAAPETTETPKAEKAKSKKASTKKAKEAKPEE